MKKTLRGLLFLSLMIPAASADLGSQAREINQAKLGVAAALAEGISVGRAEIGAAEAKTLLCAGEPCGLVFEAASFHYRIEDPFSLQVAKRNFKRATGLKLAEGSLKISDAEVVVWMDGLAGEAEESSEELAKWIAEILDAPFFRLPASQLLLSRHTGGGAAWMLIRSRHLKGQKALLLLVDPFEDRAETLYEVEVIDQAGSLDKGSYYLNELVAQPIGRAWYDRAPAPLVATALRLEVDATHEEAVRVRSTTTLQPSRTGVEMWRADLIDRRVDDSKEFPISVESVEVDGAPADFLHVAGELLVDLGKEAKAGASVVVEVVTVGRQAIRLGGDNYWRLGTWPWYPQPPLNGELATVDLSLTVSAPFEPFASGSVIERSSNDGVNKIVTRLDYPSQFPVMAAGKFEVFDHEQNGRTCRVASYAFGKPAESERLANNFFAAATWYEELFGVPYPFDDFHIVEVNSWGYGQAPPGMIFITREAFSPLSGAANQYFSGGVNERFLHEIAHAWWGHVLKMDSAEEQWLTESFAAYSAALCLEALKGGGKKGKKEFDAILKGWKNNARRAGDGGSVYLANHLAGIDREDRAARINLLYSKGPLVLHAIRLELREIAGSESDGDRYFVALLGSFLKNFQGRWASTRDLVGILNQMTKTDWQPFFDRYVYGTEMPEI